MKHKVKRGNIAIYESLPSGGAKELYLSTLDYLNEKYHINRFRDNSSSNLASKNIILYFYTALFKLKLEASRNIKSIHKSNLLLVFHSWIIKSPYVLRDSQIPTVYICHEPPREFYDTTYIKTFSLKERIINLIRLPIKIIDLKNVRSCKNLTVIANSNYSAKVIHSVYGVKSKIIYPGINTSLYNRNPSFNLRKKQILCVSSINKLKNQKYILECVSLISTNKRPSVIMVGNGGDKQYIEALRKFAEENDIDLKIDLNISRNKLIALYQESLLFCYAPLNEPFGLVILEALNAGLPIISYKNGGGYNEIISNRNGYISKSLNRNEWSVAIMSFMENRKEWQRVSNYNYKYSKRYSLANMNTQLNDVIARTISI